MNDIWTGERIQELRGTKTREEFSKHFGVTRKTITNWEEEKVQIKKRHLKRLQEIADKENDKIQITKEELCEICRITILQEAFYIEVCKMINENRKIKEILKDKFQYLE